MRDIISSWGVLNNTFPFTVSLPLPLPFPLPVLSRRLFPLTIDCSLPFPGHLLTALRVLLTLAVVIVIAIARTAPSTTRRTGICQVVIIIILVDDLIPIQLSNGQEVAWFVLPTAWWLNLCPEIIATVPRETLTGAFNLPRAGYLRIGVIDRIPGGMGIVPPAIVHLVAGFVKHLPHICAEDSPPLPKRRTPAPVLRPYQREF
jgi:hypothetical protein